MSKLGVLFDIDALKAMFYGAAAYGVLFDRIGREKLRSVRLYDGDIQSTLDGQTRIYCIAIEATDTERLKIIKTALAAHAAGESMLPMTRFLEDGAALDREPLVYAGYIDEHGVLSGCDTPWIAQAWRAKA